MENNRNKDENEKYEDIRRKELTNQKVVFWRIYKWELIAKELCLVFIASLIVMAFYFWAFHFSFDTIISPVIIALGFLVFGWSNSRLVRDSENRLNQVENEIDLLNVRTNSWEEKTIKLLKSHQLELKKYYDQTLNQSSWIFLTGIGLIIIGFAFVGGTLYLIATGNDNGNQKLIVGIIGGLTTFMANFIAVIYLRIYSETVKSLTVFHNKLVLTHHLHFANYLNSKIDDKEMRNKSLSEITLKIVEG